MAIAAKPDGLEKLLTAERGDAGFGGRNGSEGVVAGDVLFVRTHICVLRQISLSGVRSFCGSSEGAFMGNVDSRRPSAYTKLDVFFCKIGRRGCSRDGPSPARKNEGPSSEGLEGCAGLANTGGA